MKSYTDIEQSRKLAEILPIESADNVIVSFGSREGTKTVVMPKETLDIIRTPFADIRNAIPAWSLAALLKLIPKRILRKDKIHYGQTFIPSFSWEINPRAIYYTDGNNIMDYVSFIHGENNRELIDAVFKMVVWLKENGRI